MITGPDLINKDTEERVARLAKNSERIKLHHGYFLMMNPSPEQLKEGICFQQRVQVESKFFAKASWKAQDLDELKIGIENLRSFLQDHLNSHI